MENLKIPQIELLCRLARLSAFLKVECFLLLYTNIQYIHGIKKTTMKRNVCRHIYAHTDTHAEIYGVICEIGHHLEFCAAWPHFVQQRQLSKSSQF